LVSCKKKISDSTFCYDFLVSTTTDLNGNLSINDRAESKSVGYVLEVARDNNFGDELFQYFFYTIHSVLDLNLKNKFQFYPVRPKMNDLKIVALSCCMEALAIDLENLLWSQLK
jgi:hypothetical protein